MCGLTLYLMNNNQKQDLSKFSYDILHKSRHKIKPGFMFQLQRVLTKVRFYKEMSVNIQLSQFDEKPLKRPLII